MPDVVVLAVPPLVVIEKVAGSVGDPEPTPLVVLAKPNVTAPLPMFFTIVTDDGKMTASLESDRSWLPPLPSMSSSRMWYGEPVIATADAPDPQSGRVAMWPPQARTGVATLVVKVSVIDVELSPAYVPVKV